MIKALALQIGNPINYHELSSLTGFTYKELIRYITILKKTFVCIESIPFFTNRRKELTKMPKIFFLDTGFRNIIINNFQELDNRVDVGSLNENFVASELFKRELELHYWKTKAGAKVDFVVEINGKKVPIEVKTTLNNPKYGRSFKNFVEDYDVERGFILSQKYSNEIKLGKAKIKFIPIFSIIKYL